MHDSAALHKIIRTAIEKNSGQTADIASCNQIRPSYYAYVVLAHLGDDDDHGTRYLAIVNGNLCEVVKIKFYTPEIDWDIANMEDLIDDDDDDEVEEDEDE